MWLQGSVACLGSSILLTPIVAFKSTYAEGFYDPQRRSHSVTASIEDAATVTLSVILPAYNEEKRLEPMMKSTLKYLSTVPFKSELIVVDDGSRDRTFDLAVQYTQSYGIDRVRVLRLSKNCGKGAAVREGMIRARGEYCLFCDADGAAPVDQWLQLRDKLQHSGDGMAVAIGVREKQARTGLRLILSWGWHFLVLTLCSVGIRDTQCGYKLFTRSGLPHFFFCHVDWFRWQLLGKFFRSND